MNVIFAGQLRSPSGYSKAFRDFLIAFDKVNIESHGINLRVYDVKLDEESYEDKRIVDLLKKYELRDKDLKWFTKSYDYILIAYIPTCMYYQTKIKDAMKVLYSNCNYHVNMTLWETNKMPEDFVRISKEVKVDHLIANCLWNKEIFERDYSLQCDYLPCVVEPLSLSSPSTKLMEEDVFTILAVSTNVHRKGFDILVKAFVSEFNDTDKVALFIKTYYCSFGEQFKKKCKEDILVMKNSVVFGTFTDGYTRTKKQIHLLLDKYTHEEMSSIYSSADLFALFSRGEGFGLPYTEALIHGVPVACPDKGGHLDFCRPDFTFFANSYYDTCVDDCWYTADMEQIETPIKEARRALREAYTLWLNDRNAYNEKRKKAKEFFTSKESQFNYENIGNKFIQICKNLESKMRYKQ